MSENDNNGTTANGSGPQFSERELQLLGWAMQSLKSGPPEIDYEKLAAFAGMGNPRSAGNAWAKIRNKLMTPADGTAPPPTPKKGGGRKKAVKDDDGEAVQSTPKKTGGRKRAVKDNDDEAGEGTPKTPRKRQAPKQDVDGDASPKKKGRAKKASDDESNVKTESDEAQHVKPSGSPMERDAAGDDPADEI